MSEEPLTDRLRSLDRRSLAGLLLVGILVIAAAVLWYVRSLPSQVPVEAIADRTRSANGAAAPSPSPSVVVVDVAGWVHRPGVYELKQGDRVIDAIRRAGGARSGADLTGLNLAALLTDAQQIVVVKRGAAPAATGAVGSTPAGAESPGAASRVNVNTATLDQLETLPGIGPALGQRIIDYREQHGPFRSVDELINVSGIGEKTLAELRSQVSV